MKKHRYTGYKIIDELVNKIIETDLSVLKAKYTSVPFIYSDKDGNEIEGNGRLIYVDSVGKKNIPIIIGRDNNSIIAVGIATGGRFPLFAQNEETGAWSCSTSVKDRSGVEHRLSTLIGNLLPKLKDLTT